MLTTTVIYSLYWRNVSMPCTAHGPPVSKTGTLLARAPQSYIKWLPSQVTILAYITVAFWLTVRAFHQATPMGIKKFGEEGRTRTDNVSYVTDFKSVAFQPISPHPHYVYIILYPLFIVNKYFWHRRWVLPHESSDLESELRLSARRLNAWEFLKRHSQRLNSMQFLHGNRTHS